ncbi:MAG: LuxR C-terminal-related transcriptional regulator [Treponema sp.]|jgi:LuxR family maltose regulon positive regulatory protein|nr:LuxR C-terminal-related transcriptional regulator [Treponema sp.]
MIISKGIKKEKTVNDLKTSLKTNLIPDKSNLNQTGIYLERPRLHALLENALDNPLIIVCAGAGYGKTRAVNSFLSVYEATSIWLQLSERDNVTTRFWESFSDVMSFSQPKTGARMKEIGFPRTEDAYLKYYAAMRGLASLPGKHIRVFDDFHLLHNQAVLRFFEQAVNTCPLNVAIILISRTMPEFILINRNLVERTVTISEETLCFTEDEITKYFNKINLPVMRGDVRNIYDDTRGWAFAINMIGRSLIKERANSVCKYERSSIEPQPNLGTVGSLGEGSPLAAMKKNIFRLIEAEISQTVSEPLRRFLFRISLIDHLAASLIKLLANDSAHPTGAAYPTGTALVKDMESVNAYIRYDFNLDTYMIHHLLRDYLRQKQEQVLTDKERKQTYQTAGEWCDANGYHTDALSYYEKSGDYSAIAMKIGSLNVQMPPDMAKYALGIFENAPDEVKFQNTVFPGMHIRLLINTGQLDEKAAALSDMYAEIYEARPDSFEKYFTLTAIYGNWAILLMFMCTYTDVYNFDAYYKKMGECYNKKPFKTIGSFNIVPMSAWASLVGTNRKGAQEEYIDAISRSIPYASILGKGFLSGFDDLARGELCFCRGQIDDAEQYLKQSVDKARVCDQYLTQTRALIYLMQLAFFRGDYFTAAAKLKEMEAMISEEDYGVRYTMYDIACGFYQLSLDRYEHIPDWLKSDFSPYTHPSFLENFANRVKLQYHYKTHKYSALLAFIENSMEQQTILLGKIELTTLKALSLYRLKRRSEAITALAQAYHLAESNNITVMFAKYEKDIRTLTAAALKYAAAYGDVCAIPRKWLEEINRKSAAYAKRKFKNMSEYKSANNIENEITLTKRETAILKDLSDGFSRSEIAVNQNISVNTVKMYINYIYDKLGVYSLPKAIRAAVDRKLI